MDSINYAIVESKIHGKVLSPVVSNSRCVMELLKAIQAGTATINGKDGADFTLVNTGMLPDYYVTEDEADINYVTGRRNGQRVLWSNDGLVFVTYNHYETFIEIV